MDKKKAGDFFGQLFAFNNSLKLYHWHITGKGSYAQHMALDQAIGEMIPTLDGLVETAYALAGDIDITIPATKVPSDIISHVQSCYDAIEKGRDFLTESFQGGLLDEYQQSIQQLLYRLKRLS